MNKIDVVEIAKTIAKTNKSFCFIKPSKNNN